MALMRIKLLANIHSIVSNTLACRNFATTSNLKLKQIIVTTTGNDTVVEGKPIKSPREGKVLQIEALCRDGSKACPLCPEKLGTMIHYTDVLIISQFLQPDGKVLPQKATGLCYEANSRLKELTRRARTAGLLPDHNPDVPPGCEMFLPKANYKWKKNNSYFPSNPVLSHRSKRIK